MYVGLVALGAAVVVLLEVIFGPIKGVDLGTLVLLATLFVVAESIGTMVDSGKTGISPSSAASLAAAVLVGPFGAAIVGFSSVLVIRRQDLVKRLFNGAQFGLAGYVSGYVFKLLGGRVGVPGEEAFPWAILPFMVAVLVYSACNTVLVTGLMWCLGELRIQRPRRMRWRPLATLELSSIGYAMLGLFIAAIWGAVGPFAVLLVLLPLFIARWAFDQYVFQQRAHDATLATLCQAVETKDYYTRGHCMRVAKAAGMIAEELGMPVERAQTMRYAGMLHDIGKLGVPTKILQKAGKLTEDEFAAIQLHPMRGYEIVREIDFLDEALAGIMHHHERMDGGGYPMGLAGEEIPEAARLVSVADVFDCLTSTRSYRTAWSAADAIAELRRCAGTQFDPRMVEALVRAVDREGWEVPDLVEPMKDECEQIAEREQGKAGTGAPVRVAGETSRS
ncbi:HD-GYP domain-containing protein [Actinorugispora endophytica]|uniref:HD-GYP domain-containing protein n=1 Tax=Actinorugispora endophytica TaxID=1605990 RepID=UPI00105BCC0B|nr:HD-GYP domain-containing protein [Actinorugispora endophytica]